MTQIRHLWGLNHVQRCRCIYNDANFPGEYLGKEERPLLLAHCILHARGLQCTFPFRSSPGLEPFVTYTPINRGLERNV